MPLAPVLFFEFPRRVETGDEGVFFSERFAADGMNFAVQKARKIDNIYRIIASACRARNYMMSVRSHFAADFAKMH
jgi:hypothetical protein